MLGLYESKRLHRETFEKCSILPAQLNRYFIFNRGSRPRAILQDSRIGQLTSCPQGRGAWAPRVNAKILKGTKLSIIFVEIKPNKILDNMGRNT